MNQSKTVNVIRNVNGYELMCFLIDNPSMRLDFKLLNEVSGGEFRYHL